MEALRAQLGEAAAAALAAALAPAETNSENIDLDQYCLASKCSDGVRTWTKYQCAH